MSGSMVAVRFLTGRGSSMRSIRTRRRNSKVFMLDVFAWCMVGNL